MDLGFRLDKRPFFLLLYPLALKIDFIYLLKAIEENANISVHYIVDEQEVHHYLSRFFETDREERTVTIDFPTGDGESTKPLVPKDNISVLFKFAGFRFLFHSEVLEKLEYRLNEEKDTKAFKIRLPEEILDGNRRKFFRVLVPSDQPIVLHYRKVGAGGAKTGVSLKSRSFEALMLDISEGGIALRSEKAPNISKGDRLQFQFRLEGAKTEIKMEGVVRSTRKYGGDDVHLWGIEYVPKKDINYKRALNRINKYIMATQRKNLNQLR